MVAARDPVKLQEYRTRWKRRNKDKVHAHKAIARAIAAGRLHRPSYCEMCGDVSPLSAHHDSYEPGDRLRAVFLCTPCHEFVHKVRR